MTVTVTEDAAVLRSRVLQSCPVPDGLAARLMTGRLSDIEALAGNPHLGDEPWCAGFDRLADRRWSTFVTTTISKTRVDHMVARACENRVANARRLVVWLARQGVLTETHWDRLCSWMATHPPTWDQAAVHAVLAEPAVPSWVKRELVWEMDLVSAVLVVAENPGRVEDDVELLCGSTSSRREVRDWELPYLATLIGARPQLRDPFIGELVASRHWPRNVIAALLCAIGAWECGSTGVERILGWFGSLEQTSWTPKSGVDALARLVSDLRWDPTMPEAVEDRITDWVTNWFRLGPLLLPDTDERSRRIASLERVPGPVLARLWAKHPRRRSEIAGATAHGGFSGLAQLMRFLNGEEPFAWTGSSTEVRLWENPDLLETLVDRELVDASRSLGGSESCWQIALDLLETGEFTWPEAVEVATGLVSV